MAWSSCRLRRVVGHRIQRAVEWVLRGRLERERLRVELRRAHFDLAVERAAREAAEERAYQAEKCARNAEMWASVRVPIYGLGKVWTYSSADADGWTKE